MYALLASMVFSHTKQQARTMFQHPHRTTGRHGRKWFASAISGFLWFPLVQARTNDPIYAPLHLFTPISPLLLESRQREAEILPGQHSLHLTAISAHISPDTFTLTLHSGTPSIRYGNLSQYVAEEHRAKRVEHLLIAIKPFVQFL